MFDIIAQLHSSPVVKQVQVIEMLDESTVKYLKCFAELLDDSRLYITESYSAGKNKYSYHWQDRQNRLILRWDNAPHFPHLSTFPHHKHESKKVYESPRILIDEVLQEIENRFRKTGILT